MIQSKEEFDEMYKLYPFLTRINYNNSHYHGVVSFVGEKTLSMYVIDFLYDKNDLVNFLKICEEWWYTTSRKNISLVYRDRMQNYKKILKHFVISQIKEFDGNFKMKVKEKKRKKQKTIILK